MAKEQQLRERVASGVAWSIGEKVGSALMQIAVSIIVANELMPMDMGIMAILTVFTALAQVVVDSGFSQMLIRKQQPTEGDFRAVFLFNIITAFALYAIFTACSPLLARFYGWPILAKVAPVLFLIIPLNAVCVIQNTIMVREFRFASLSTIIFVAALVSGIVAVAMALNGCGVWSLVGQRVSQMVVKAVLLWWTSNWRPKAKCNDSTFREMIPYSMRLMGTDLINSLYNNISQLFIGRIYSADALGFFNQAQKLKDMPVTSTMQSIQSVTFPALAKINDNEEKFIDSYRRVVMLTAYIIFPIMVGLISTADDIYTLLLKPQWHPAVPYFKTLCLVGLFYPIAAVSYNVLKVRSNGAIILRLEIIKKLIMTLILVATIPQSVMAIAWGLVVASASEMILNYVASRRYASLTVWDFVRTLLPIAIVTAVMYGAIMFEAEWLTDWSVGMRLAMKILTGVVVYISASAAMRMEAFAEALTIARQILSRK